MRKSAKDVFQRAFAGVGYSYDEETTTSFSDIYHFSAHLHTRSGGLDFASHLGECIPNALRARGEGEVQVQEDLTVEHVARDQFEYFRRFMGINETEYINAFSEVTGGAVSDGGRSGSLYWFSKDKRYILKSASESDMNKLEDMMPRYLEHFQTAEQQGRPCFLLRFFGAYRFRAGDEVLALICMNDVWEGQKPSRIYDLKGTTHHRFVEISEEDNENVVLKDLNLDSSFLIQKNQGGNKVTEALEQDTAFLEYENSIDYSLLLGIDEPTTVLRSSGGQRGVPTYKGYEFSDEEAEEDISGWRTVQTPQLKTIVQVDGSQVTCLTTFLLASSIF
jgi:hypothetical protein